MEVPKVRNVKIVARIAVAYFFLDPNEVCSTRKRLKKYTEPRKTSEVASVAPRDRYKGGTSKINEAEACK